MDDLTAWLRDQLDDDEVNTRTLLYWAQQTILTLKEPRLLGKEIPGWHDWPAVETLCQRHLAAVNADQAILRQYEEAKKLATGGYDISDYVEDALDQVVSHIAAKYADRPGYRTEWAPEASRG